MDDDPLVPFAMSGGNGRRLLVALGLGALVLGLLAIPASAQEPASDGGGQLLFGCRLQSGSVRVTTEGERLVLHYEAQGEAPVRLAAGVGDVRYLTQRFAGMAYQLRFIDGERSYVVFSLEGNPNVDAQPVSGLVVMSGGERLRDESCASHTEFHADYDYSRLPADDEAHSAI